MVKKHCAVSKEWIANRLAMGHPAVMSKVVKLDQESKEGSKLMKYYEKILKSKYPIHDRIYGLLSCKESGMIDP